MESSQLTVVMKNAENTAKQSVQEANVKLRDLLRSACKKVFGDNSIAQAILKEPSTQTKRSFTGK